ncbi:MAG: DUF4363 family protein [Elainella sp.]
MKLKQLLALGAAGMISTAVLAGCTTSNTTAEAPMNSGAPATETTGQTAGQTIGNTSGLKQVVTNTKTAVEAGDFSKAKTEFDQFETAWKPIEDGIKAKSPQGYDAIEANMDKVGNALNSADKTQALASLQSLEQAIATVGP